MNKKYTTLFLTSIIVLTTSVQAQWNNVWTDNFNGINYGKWTKGYKNGRTTNATTPNTIYPSANVWSNSGKLVLRADGVNSGGYEWRGAAITTYNKFTVTNKARIRARIKIPYRNGINPGFWLGPQGSWPPEIDIVEMPGAASNGGKKPRFNVWWGTASNPQSNSKSYTFNNPITGSYRYYRIDWWNNGIDWYIDGVKLRSNWNASQIPDGNMFIQFSISVHNDGGSWWGTPPNNNWSSHMYVDWLKVDK